MWTIIGLGVVMLLALASTCGGLVTFQADATMMWLATKPRPACWPPLSWWLIVWMVVQVVNNIAAVILMSSALRPSLFPLCAFVPTWDPPTHRWVLLAAAWTWCFASNTLAIAVLYVLFGTRRVSCARRVAVAHALLQTAGFAIMWTVFRAVWDPVRWSWVANLGPATSIGAFAMATVVLVPVQMWWLTLIDGARMRR